MLKKIQKVALSMLMTTMMGLMMVSPSTAYAQKTVVLKAGTPVILSTITPVSSKDINIGSMIDFQVITDVRVGSDIVIPAGTIAKGQAASVSKSAALGKGGSLTLSVSNINAVDGTLVPLSGATVSAQGDSKVGLAVVCGLCTLLGFLIHGDQAEIPAGTQVQAMVMANTSINF